jgi:hypothetical protein
MTWTFDSDWSLRDCRKAVKSILPLVDAEVLRVMQQLNIPIRNKSSLPKFKIWDTDWIGGAINKDKMHLGTGTLAKSNFLGTLAHELVHWHDAELEWPGPGWVNADTESEEYKNRPWEILAYKIEEILYPDFR